MSVITIDTSQLVKGGEILKNLSGKLAETIDDVLNANAIEIEEKAKQLAPVDMGLLRGQITANVSTKLKKEINVNVFYAAWIEFGTGAYAAAYVSSLPPTWQQYAAQFKAKGQGSGTFFDFLVAIKAWVKRVGIGVSYSVSTRRKRRQTNADIENIAYMIAMNILRKGIKPHPFLYPAIAQQQPILIRDLETAIKNVK